MPPLYRYPYSKHNHPSPRQFQHFTRLIRSIETYNQYVDRGDIVELTKNEAGPEFGPAFKATFGKPIMLINATAQIALTHHLDDEISKQISVAANEQTANQTNLAAVDEKSLLSAARTFKALNSVARLIFSGNQATLSANAATRRATGVDLLAELGGTHLVAEKNENSLTPSDIGKQVGLSGQVVNKLLTQMGLQTAFRDSKNNLKYNPTETGKQYGEMMDTSKKHSDGTPVKQLKWFTSVMEVAQAELNKAS